MRKVTQAEIEERREAAAAKRAERERYRPDRLVQMIQRLTALTAGDKLRAGEMSDDDRAAIADLFPQHRPGRDYSEGDTFAWQGELYEVIQPHTSQADWRPDETPALYKSHAPSGVIPEWVQPTGAHDAYSTGDQVAYEGATWTSLVDGNVWPPEGGSLWESSP